MCGIVGFIDYNHKFDKNILQSMRDTLIHRGPDDSGLLFESNELYNIGLGHRRLSILDLSKNGKQPMKFKHLTIVYNGEIYNFREIRKNLVHAGYKFESDCDAEVILKAFHYNGVESVKLFNGFFSYIIYDSLKHKLYIFRDRLGVKPLFIYKDINSIIFSSEIKSFKKINDFNKEINIISLSEYFTNGYITKDKSIFKHVKKVMPGHYLDIDILKTEEKTTRYWNLLDYFKKPKFNENEVIITNNLENLLESAFKYRLVSDVPVGVFLSGGIDSSLVCALLQKNMTKKINTFTIGVEGEKLDEAPYARKISKHLGTNHHEYYCKKDDFISIFKGIADIYDEPFGDSSIVPSILVSQIASKSVKVVLSADGGDELFSGYDNFYKTMNYYNCLKKLPFHKQLSSIISLIEKNEIYNQNLIKIPNIKGKVCKTNELLSSNNNFEKIFQILNKANYNYELIKLLNIDQTNFFKYQDTSAFPNKQDSKIQKLLYLSSIYYLPDNIMNKVDKATMSCSIEGREPFLDHRIFEFAAQLPFKYKFRKGKTKYILRKILEKHVPSDYLVAKKMGFSIPINTWLKTDIKDFMLSYINKDNLNKSSLLNTNFILKELDNFLNNKSNSRLIWFVLVYMIWQESWFG